jgi:hypothetical protein
MPAPNHEMPTKSHSRPVDLTPNVSAHDTWARKDAHIAYQNRAAPQGTASAPTNRSSRLIATRTELTLSQSCAREFKRTKPSAARDGPVNSSASAMRNWRGCLDAGAVIDTHAVSKFELRPSTPLRPPRPKSRGEVRCFARATRPLLSSAASRTTVPAPSGLCR